MNKQKIRIAIDEGNGTIHTLEYEGNYGAEIKGIAELVIFNADKCEIVMSLHLLPNWSFTIYNY